MSVGERIKAYYQLTKPGIVYGNSIHLIAGILIAAAIPMVTFRVETALGVLIGTALIIASACVANNYIERESDRKMQRTRDRALVNGVIGGRAALVYATLLGLFGLLILMLFTPWIVWVLACVAYVFYVWLYTYSKPVTVHSTLIGSVPGALPIVAGYTALVGHIDVIALLLFLLVVCWQMPHFYAISLFRRDEYAAAGMPVLAVKYNERVVKIHILTYQLLYMVAIVALGLYGALGIIATILLAILGGWWLVIGLRGFRAKNTVHWAHQIFGTSLIITCALPVITVLNLVLG